MRKINMIVIHCSATKDNKYLSDFEAIRKFHIEENGWRDIGYHYVCEYVNGKFGYRAGRAEISVGAHVEGYNANSIGVCHVGNWDTVAPSDADIDVVAKLVADICKRYKLNETKIYTHNSFNPNKSCPGLKYPMAKLKAKVKVLLGR